MEWKAQMSYEHCEKHNLDATNGCIECADRPSWDQWFMEIAQVVAKRATCARKHVGAVIVLGNNIVATGYNGSARGAEHCSGPRGIGHEMKMIEGRESCVRTLHAESNALDKAGWDRCLGATIYVTVIPCYDCAKRIDNAGIQRVVYGEYYPSRNTELVLEYFKGAGVEVLELR